MNQPLKRSIDWDTIRTIVAPLGWLTVLALGFGFEHLAGSASTTTPPILPGFALACGMVLVRGMAWSGLIPLAVLPSALLGSTGGIDFEADWRSAFVQAVAVMAGVAVAAQIAPRVRGELRFSFRQAELARLLLGSVVAGPFVASLLLVAGPSVRLPALTETWSQVGAAALLLVPAIVVWRPSARRVALESHQASTMFGIGVGVLILTTLLAGDFHHLASASFVAGFCLLTGSAIWGTARWFTGIATATFLALVAVVVSGTVGGRPEVVRAAVHSVSDLGLVTLGGLIIVALRAELRLRGRRLEAQRQLLQAVVDHIPGAVSVSDQTGQLLFANRFLRDFAGIDPERISEHSVDTHVEREAPTTSHVDGSERIGGSGATEEPRWQDAELLGSDGKRLPVLETTVPLEQTFGDSPAVLRISLDSRERLLAEEAVRSSQAELTALLRSIPGTVIKLSEDRRILLSSDPNDEQQRMQPLAALFDPRDHAKVSATFASLYPGSGHTAMVEARLATPPHELVELRITRLNDLAGGFTAILHSVESLRAAERARRRLEEEMNRVARLESLGLLAGGIAHDFNNLLTGILGNSEMAAESAADQPEVIEHLSNVQAGALRAAELCRQLLAYAGRGELVTGPLDLSAVIREILGPMQPRLSSSARLTVDLVDGLPPIEGDTVRIQQVVMNLVANASDALPQGTGNLDISTSCRHWSSEELSDDRLSTALPAGEYVSFAVRDDGTGIEPENLRRIFEPFFSTKKKGTGLGLAAAHGLVHSQKGAIRVDSEVGRGTVFELLFPARRDLSVDVGDAIVAVAADAGTVLVVDDEVLVRDLARVALSKAGFEVVLAEDGKEALQILQASDADRFDCMVLDLTMPRLSGEGVVEKASEILPDLPIVLVSGYSPKKLGGRMRALPFVAKPFRPAVLVEEVRAACAGRTTDSERDAPTKDVPEGADDSAVS